MDKKFQFEKNKGGNNETVIIPPTEKRGKAEEVENGYLSKKMNAYVNIIET